MPHTERELLQLVAAGNEAAFTTLFHQYRARIDAIAFAITGSETAAEELLQDIFLKIWLRRRDLVNIDNFSSYLFIVTRNEAYTALRRVVREREVITDAHRKQAFTDSDTENRIMDREYGRLLQKAIDRLPEQQKQVYRLSREKGLNREEIAAALHISPNTVKSHMAQALKSIRAFCIAHLDDPYLLLMVIWLSAGDNFPSA